MKLDISNFDHRSLFLNYCPLFVILTSNNIIQLTRVKTSYIKILLAVTFFILITILVIGVIASLVGDKNSGRCDEDKPKTIVFFKIGMDKEIINNFESKLKNELKEECVEFTSEEEAYQEYYDHLEGADEQFLLKILEEQEARVLPSSFTIYSDENTSEVNIKLIVDLLKVRYGLEDDAITVQRDSFK